MYSPAVLHYNQVIPVHHHPCCTKNHLPDQSQVGRLPVQREDDDQLVFSKLPLLLEFLQKACEIYLVVCMLLLISAFLNSLYEISNEHETLRNRPLKGIYQMIKLIAFGIGFIVIISIITASNATSILAGLGASAAV